MGRGKRESLFLLPIVPHVIAILLLLLFLLGYPVGASVTQTACGELCCLQPLSQQSYLYCSLILMPHINRFFSLAEGQIAQSKNSALFQIHEMCLNKLIIIKIFCGHDNLMPVETRSAFASTSFFLFLSVFLHFLSEQHVFISTCRS